MNIRLVLFFLCAISLVLNGQTGPKLLGMTQLGGQFGYGTIFQYTGGDTTIGSVNSFSPSDGLPQNSTLIKANNGLFYGLTLNNLIEYNTTSNSYVPKVSFNITTGEGGYESLLLANNGNLYGLTNIGGSNIGGTIYEYTVGDTFITRLFDLDSNARSYGSLIQGSDSNLYGMTNSDGINSLGTIFRYNLTTSTFDTLFNFSTATGSKPEGDLLEVGRDTFYGMTRFGGPNNGGSFFRFIASSRNYTALQFFPSQGGPLGSVIRANDSNLYGYFNGGTNNAGALFQYNIGLRTFTVLYNFQDSAGDYGYPSGAPYQASDGKLYGMTTGDGFSPGNIFQFDITTHQIFMKVILSGPTGFEPEFGHLTEYTVPTGIAPVSEHKFNLYPNPTTGLFTITNNTHVIIEVTLISLLGERLKTFTTNESESTLNVTDLSAGIYAVEISNGNHTLEVLKLVKQ